MNLEHSKALSSHPGMSYISNFAMSDVLLCIIQQSNLWCDVSKSNSSKDKLIVTKLFNNSPSFY
jgi:hypothetical protein